MTEEQRTGSSEQLQLETSVAHVRKMEEMKEEITDVLKTPCYSWDLSKNKKIKDAFTGGWRHDLQHKGRLTAYYQALKKIEEMLKKMALEGGQGLETKLASSSPFKSGGDSAMLSTPAPVFKKW